MQLKPGCSSRTDKLKLELQTRVKFTNAVEFTTRSEFKSSFLGRSLFRNSKLKLELQTRVKFTNYVEFTTRSDFKSSRGIHNAFGVQALACPANRSLKAEL